MKYLINLIKYNNNVEFIDEEKKQRVQRATLEEFIEMYKNKEIKIDENELLKYRKKNTIEYQRIMEFKSIIDEIKDISKLKTNSFILQENNNIYFYKNLKNIISINQYSFINSDRELILNKYNEMLTEENILPESKKILEKIKTINFIQSESTKEYYITFENKMNLNYFACIYKDILNKDIFKENMVLKSKNYIIKLSNINEIYFIKDIFKNKLNYDFSNLPKETLKYIKNTEEIIENKITHKNYNENVISFIEKNNGNAVIADSIENKNKAVIEYFNKTSEKVLVIGKPEGIEKYKNLGLNNAYYASLDNFTSKNGINDIQTENNLIQIKDNILYVNNEEREITEKENLKLDVSSNRPKVFNIKNEKENIVNGTVKTLNRNIEILKILEFLQDNYPISKEMKENYLDKNYKNSNIDELIKNILSNFNINIKNEKENEELKKKLKIKSKKEITLQDFIKKLTKNIQYNEKKEEYFIKTKEINISFSIDKEPVKDFNLLLDKIDKKNNNRYFSKKLSTDNNFYIKDNELYFSYTQTPKDLEKEKVENYSTESSRKLIENTKDINKVIILNAEKVKSPTSTVSNTFLHMIKNKNFKNKIFVSSNPIYNKISEIEVIFKSLDEELFESLKEVIESYNTRKSKIYKENFLGLIAKRYILKRNSEELEPLLKDKKIQEMNFLNSKEIGDLSKESLYFNQIKTKILSKIKDIIEISIARINNNKDYIIGENITEKYAEKYFDYYFKSYENFQILIGKKLNSYDVKKIHNMILEDKANSFSIEDIEKMNIDEVKKILGNNDKFKKYLKKRKSSLSDTLYNKIVNTKFKKVATFDPVNNEYINGQILKTKHITSITKLVEEFPYLNNKEKEVFLHQLKYDLEIKEYSKYFDNLFSTIENYLNYPNYGTRLSKYQSLYNEGGDLDVNNKEDCINKLKAFKKLKIRVNKELYGEDISFKTILQKSLSVRKMRRTLSELKVPNTIEEIKYNLQENKNCIVFSTNNSSLLEIGKILENQNVNVINVKSTNKNEIMKNLKNEITPYVVLSGYKMLSEHIDNEFEGEVILNDLPFNQASLEQSVSSIKNNKLDLWYKHNEEEEFEKMFKYIILSRNKEISQIMSTEEEIFKESNINEEFFKDNFIKQIFNNYLSKITEKEFNEIKTSAEKIYRTNSANIQSNKIIESFDDIVFC